jgi:UDP-glucose 4-epimerase
VTASAAVIGASGFIGSRLVSALSDLGVPTTGLTRSTPLVRAGRPVAALRRADVIFFLASSITPAVAATGPGRAAQDQACLAGLLEALRTEGTRPAFVLTSSGGTVYDPDAPAPYPESAPTKPTTAYGRAKLRMERMVRARLGVIRPVILRPATVYGPGQHPRGAQGVIAHWLAAARRDQPLKLFGDPRTGRDYVFVADAVQAMVAVYRLTAPPRWDPGDQPLILNLGSGVRTALIDLLATLVQTVRRPVVVEFEPARPFDRSDVWLDVSAAARTLGWWPSTTLADGIAATWDAMLELHTSTGFTPGWRGSRAVSVVSDDG